MANHNVLSITVKKQPVRSTALWELAHAYRFPLSFGLPLVRETGVGFIMDGYLITSFHLIAAAEMFGAKQGDGFLDVQLHHSNPQKDYAIFAPISSSFTGLNRFHGAVEVGQKLYVLSFDLSGKKEVIDCILTDFVSSSVIGNRLFGPLLKLEAPILKGHSGSPLVNAGGDVVGMIIAAEEGRFGYAIPATELRSIPSAKTESTIQIRCLQACRVEAVGQRIANLGLQPGDVLLARNGEEIEPGRKQLPGIIEVGRDGRRHYVVLPPIDIQWSYQE